MSATWVILRMKTDAKCRASESAKKATSSLSYSDKSEPPGFHGAAVSYGTEEKHQSLVLLTSHLNSAFKS